MIYQKLKTRDNLPDVIVCELRDAILSGVMAPGTRLKQKEVADQFEMSLIPVREAFRTLENEGLLTLVPHKGAVVSAVSADEAKHIFELRLILELGALELAAPKITSETTAQAEEILETMNHESSVAMLSQYNKAFHMCLYGGCGNPLLLQTIEKHYESIDRYMRLYLNDQKHHQYSQQVHQNILNAIAERDIRLAKQWLREHMNRAKEELIVQIEIKGGQHHER
jgi:DNA-binding GntR family transcriptional regulator